MLSNDVFTDIFMRCQSHLARVVSRIVPPHEIEDIVQETYVRVCQFRTREEIREPRALMVRTARNLALDHIKRAEARLTTSFDEALEQEPEALGLTGNPLSRVASDEEFGRFCEVVRKMPQQCKRVFVLKKVYGYSQREIAAELNLSESTVEKHISKGMKFCAEQMWKEGTNCSRSADSGRGVRS